MVGDSGFWHPVAVSTVPPASGHSWRWHVALSFAGAQRPYVAQVADRLRARGVRCFYDAEEQVDLWGRDLYTILPQIYAEAAAMVVIFGSAEYAARDWTRLERRAALGRAARERREYVLPARFDDTLLPELEHLGAVDLRERSPSDFADLVTEKLRRLGLLDVAPAAAPGRPRARDDLTVVHVSDLELDGGDDPSSAAGALLADVTTLAAGRTPDLLVVSGDVMSTGSRPEAERALDFLQRTADTLGLPASRVVVVPGDGDVSRELAHVHFLESAARGVAPQSPFWRKWEHFVWLQRALYGVESTTSFEVTAPWSIFAFPELSVVVAGLNSTMAESHVVRGGSIEAAQVTAMAQKLADYQRRGWLVVGVVHHHPVPDLVPRPLALQDADLVVEGLGGQFDVLLHGHATGPEPHRLGGDLLALAAGGPPSGGSRRPDRWWQLLAFGADGVSRRVRHRPGDGSWSDATEVAEGEVLGLGAGRGGARGSTAPDPALPVPDAGAGLPPRPPDVVDGLAEVAQLRFPGATIRRGPERAGFPAHLVIRRAEGTVVECRVVGVWQGRPSVEDVLAFRTSVVDPYRQDFPGAVADLVYLADAQVGPELSLQAQRQGVRLMSLHEYQGVLDLRDYLRGQAARLDAAREYPPQLYVPQRMTRLDLAEDTATEDAVGELVAWLSADQSMFVLVLGNSGNGKSFLLRQLTRRLMREGSGVIPILVELRHLEKQQSLNTLVSAHLSSAGETRFDLDAFRYMFHEGRVVLLFDGFDELAVRTTYQQAAEHLGGLIDEMGHRAKIVLSSRTQHFLTEDQVHRALASRVLDAVPGSRLARLEDFTERQILLFLENWYRRDVGAVDDPAGRARARLAMIRGVPNLLGLARTPRMLAFIAALPEERLSASGTTPGGVNAAELYGHLISEWLGYEERRAGRRGAPSWLTGEQRHDAVTRLAVQTFLTGRDIRVDDLTATALEILESMADSATLSEAELAQMLGSGTLLVRDEYGRFSFIHASVMEFLVAREAARQLAAGTAQPAGAVLLQRELTDLTMTFFVQSAGRDDLVAWVRDVLDDRDATDAARANAMAAARLAKIPVRTGYKLAHTNQAGRDLSELELRGADLRLADLTEATMVGNDLTGGDARESVLRRATLRDVVATDVIATGADLSEAVLEGGTFRGAILRWADFRRATVRDVDLAETDLREADFRGARLLDSSLAGAQLAGSRWDRAVVVGVPEPRPAELGDAVVPGHEPPDVVVAPPSGGASGIAYSPDGAILACAYGTLVLLMESSGRLLRVLHGHPGRVRAVAFADARTLFSASVDGTVLVWDVVTARQLAALPFDGAAVTAMSVAGDGLVAVAGADRSVVLWRRRDGGAPHLVGTVSERFDVTAIAADGHGVLAVAGDSGDMELWDVSQPSAARRMSAPVGGRPRVTAMAFSPTGELVTGTADGVALLWERPAGEAEFHQAGQLKGHSGPVTGAAFGGPGGRLVSTVAADGTAAVWRRPDLAGPLHSFDLVERVNGVAVAPDGRGLAMATADGRVRIQGLASPGKAVTVRGHDTRVSAVAFTPDGTRLLSTGSDGRTRIWDTRLGCQERWLAGHDDVVSALAVSHDGSQAATGGADGRVRVWDVASGRQLAVFPGLADRVTAVAFTPAGDRLAAASGDLVRVWNVRSRDEESRVANGRGTMNALVFLPDGKRVVTAGSDRRARIWRVDTRELEQELIGHADAVEDVAITGDGATVATASADGTVRLWNAAEGSTIAPPLRHLGPVSGVRFGPDGRWLATASADGKGRVWRLRGGDPAAAQVLTGHAGALLGVDVAPDGRSLVTCSIDGSIRWWNLPDPSVRAVLTGFQDGGWAFVLPDGRYKHVGDPAGALWWAIGSVRFERGELDAWDRRVVSLSVDAPIWTPAAE